MPGVKQQTAHRLYEQGSIPARADTRVGPYHDPLNPSNSTGLEFSQTPNIGGLNPLHHQDFFPWPPHRVLRDPYEGEESCPRPADRRVGSRASQTSSIIQLSEIVSMNSGLITLMKGNIFLNSSCNLEKEINRTISARAGDNLANVGRLTSSITLWRRSSGATKYKGIFRLGCMAIKSDIRSKPEYMEVVLSISKAAMIEFRLSQSTSMWAIVFVVASLNCKGNSSNK